MVQVMMMMMEEEDSPRKGEEGRGEREFYCGLLFIFGSVSLGEPSSHTAMAPNCCCCFFLQVID